MGEADLAGPRHGAAADQGRGADARVRAPERPLGDQAPERRVGSQGVHLGDRDRLGAGELGQQAGEAPGEHRLARARRADQEEVVAAGRRHLERPLGRLLAAHLREVGAAGAGRSPAARHPGRLARSRPQQVVERLGQGVDRDRPHRPQGGGLAGGRGGQEQLLDAERRGELGDREAAPDRPDGAVETELAGEQPPGQGLLGDLAVAREQGQGDPQVQVVALLAQVGRGEVDQDHPRRQPEAGVADRPAHPLPALAHGGVGQADDAHAGELAEVDVDLDLDRPRLDAPGGRGNRSRQCHDL